MKYLQGAVLAAVLSALSIGAAFANGDDDETAAIGQAGQASEVSRTVKVDMSDTMRFTPAHIAVKQGETIRFAVTNNGKIKHELVLGTEDELKEHYEMMKKMPEMEHADANMLSVAPGGKGEMIWKFTKAGTVNFACLQPGHYEAGMKGDVAVAAFKPKATHGNHKH